MQLIIELPNREEQIDRNRQRWEELLRDSTLADVPFRIETNAHGQIIMTPPPAGEHNEAPRTKNQEPRPSQPIIRSSTIHSAKLHHGRAEYATSYW